MNEKILSRVIGNLERLSKTTMEYATISADPEVEIEGRFYQALAIRVKNAGFDVGDIVPAERQDRDYETYVGPGGYVMSYDPNSKGRGHRIIQRFTLSGELVKEYASAEAASKDCGISMNSVTAVAGGRSAMARGMVFRYKRY